MPPVVACTANKIPVPTPERIPPNKADKKISSPAMVISGKTYTECRRTVYNMIICCNQKFVIILTYNDTRSAAFHWNTAVYRISKSKCMEIIRNLLYADRCNCDNSRIAAFATSETLPVCAETLCAASAVPFSEESVPLRLRALTECTHGKLRCLNLRFCISCRCAIY